MPPAALRSGERESRIARLEAERFDLVVIGGGITGAGIACERARRGLRVALLEAGDFATGTSSRSSKFIHGGLRYLALGDVATVRSTALERKVLHRIAPHLAEPHWVVVPARSWAGLAKLRAALRAYEKLGEVEDADRHRNWSGEELARGEPILEGAIYTASGVRSYLLARGAKVLQLQPLPPDITEQIARDFLGVAALDEHVRSLFRSRVDGSPLFTIELAFQLRTDELISVVGTGEWAQARLSVPPAELDRLRLPVRVEEVFRARLGGLSERQRSVIKAASVVGTSFDEMRVLAADPLLDPRLLPDELNDLERKKVIETGAEGWRFAHTLIRDLAQQSLLPSELRQRHRALAEWYEARELQPEDYAIIARHWAAANEPARQIEYLEAAATNALAKGAEEAASLVETAMAVDASLAQSLATVSDRRRAFWYSQLGQALADQNRLDDAIRQFGTALRLLGQRVPKTRLGWLAYLIWQTAIQVLHLLPVVGPRLVNRGDATVLSQAAWIASKLAQTYYFKAQAVQTLAVHLAAINLAEKAGDPGLAGVAYSGLGNLVGTMRLHRLASRYLQLAREKIEGERSGTESRLTLEVLPDLAWEHGLTATVSEAVYLRTMNRAMDVTPMLDEVVEQFRAFGQNQALEITLAVRGFFHHADGKLRSARADFEEQLISARRRGNAEHVIWGLTLLIPVLTSLDRTTEALALDSEAVQLFEEKDRLNRPNFYGSHVQALVAQGLTAEALSFARQSLKTLAGCRIGSTSEG
jgi:tetratricopeptide (TPR) repeat protein